MDKEIKLSNKGSWISLLVGGPIGVFMVALVFAFFIGLIVLLSGEGLGAMGIFFIYYEAVIGLVCAFLFSLWFTGRIAQYYLMKGRGLLFTSFMYSLVTNVFIWSVFIAVKLLTYFDLFWGVILPCIAFLISTTLSVFTIGLLICFLIRKGIS